MDEVTMRVNRVDNNTNNVNFKAKPIIQIGEELIEYLGTRPRVECAQLTDELAAIVRFFSRASSTIGKESDTFALQSTGNYMLNIVPNAARRDEDKLTVPFFGAHISPMVQMTRGISLLASKFGNNKKLNLDLLCSRPYADFTYRLDGEKVVRVPFADRPTVSDAPQELTVEDCLNMIRSLNTKA